MFERIIAELKLGPARDDLELARDLMDDAAEMLIVAERLLQDRDSTIAILHKASRLPNG